MGERKAIFIDVDGTLVDERGRVPDSAVQAITSARSRGHLVFLATGRSAFQLWPEILAVGFDGLVGSSGSYVEIDGEVLAEHHLTEDQLRQVAGYFGSGTASYFLQSNDASYASVGSRSQLQTMMAHLDIEIEGAFTFVDAVVDEDGPRGDVAKVIYFDCTEPVDVIRAQFPDLEVVPSSVDFLGRYAGEMSQGGITKATGIDVVLERVGLALADAIAFGDSYNDVQMLGHVGLGIAMGGAPAEVVRVATETTARPADDGLALAFRRHGLSG
ncbi:MAG: HAD family hydrolase [Propioniciclava sp.]